MATCGDCGRRLDGRHVVVLDYRYDEIAELRMSLCQSCYAEFMRTEAGDVVTVYRTDRVRHVVLGEPPETPPEEVPAPQREH
jgi:hypothetical protein